MRGAPLDRPVALVGIRVACLAVYVPAPVAALRLATLGAQVTRIEPITGDPLAQWNPGWYRELIAGQRVLRLDVKSDRGRQMFDRVLERSDLLLTALRPSSLNRLGLSWESLQARHPRLSHVAIVGHPSPDGDMPGHDLTYQAEAGLLTPPQMPATLLADLAGAERAVSASLALLLARERGLGAGRAEVSLAETAHALAAPMRHGITLRNGVLGGAHAGYGLYQARDGWIALGALEPHYWERLLTALELDPEADHERVATAFLAHDAERWEQWAAECGLPLVAVR